MTALILAAIMSYTNSFMSVSTNVTITFPAESKWTEAFRLDPTSHAALHSILDAGCERAVTRQTCRFIWDPVYDVYQMGWYSGYSGAVYFNNRNRNCFRLVYDFPDIVDSCHGLAWLMRPSIEHLLPYRSYDMGDTDHPEDQAGWEDPWTYMYGYVGPLAYYGNSVFDAATGQSTNGQTNAGWPRFDWTADFLGGVDVDRWRKVFPTYGNVFYGDEFFGSQGLKGILDEHPDWAETNYSYRGIMGLPCHRKFTGAFWDIADDEPWNGWTYTFDVFGETMTMTEAVRTWVYDKIDHMGTDTTDPDTDGEPLMYYYGIFDLDEHLTPSYPNAGLVWRDVGNEVSWQDVLDAEGLDDTNYLHRVAMAFNAQGDARRYPEFRLLRYLPAALTALFANAEYDVVWFDPEKSADPYVVNTVGNMYIDGSVTYSDYKVEWTGYDVGTIVTDSPPGFRLIPGTVPSDIQSTTNDMSFVFTNRSQAADHPYAKHFGTSFGSSLAAYGTSDPVVMKLRNLLEPMFQNVYFFGPVGGEETPVAGDYVRISMSGLFFYGAAPQGDYYIVGAVAHLLDDITSGALDFGEASTNFILKSWNYGVLRHYDEVTDMTSPDIMYAVIADSDNRTNAFVRTSFAASANAHLSSEHTLDYTNEMFRGNTPGWIEYGLSKRDGTYPYSTVDGNNMFRSLEFNFVSLCGSCTNEYSGAPYSVRKFENMLSSTESPADDYEDVLGSLEHHFNELTGKVMTEMADCVPDGVFTRDGTTLEKHRQEVKDKAESAFSEANGRLTDFFDGITNYAPIVYRHNPAFFGGGDNPLYVEIANVTGYSGYYQIELGDKVYLPSPYCYEVTSNLFPVTATTNVEFHFSASTNVTVSENQTVRPTDLPSYGFILVPYTGTVHVVTSLVAVAENRQPWVDHNEIVSVWLYDTFYDTNHVDMTFTYDFTYTSWISTNGFVDLVASTGENVTVEFPYEGADPVTRYVTVTSTLEDVSLDPYYYTPADESLYAVTTNSYTWSTNLVTDTGLYVQLNTNFEAFVHFDQGDWPGMVKTNYYLVDMYVPVVTLPFSIRNDDVYIITNVSGDVRLHREWAETVAVSATNDAWVVTTNIVSKFSFDSVSTNFVLSLDDPVILGGIEMAVAESITNEAGKAQSCEAGTRAVIKRNWNWESLRKDD